jgi:hypothetical protein
MLGARGVLVPRARLDILSGVAHPCSARRVASVRRDTARAFRPSSGEPAPWHGAWRAFLCGAP